MQRIEEMTTLVGPHGVSFECGLDASAALSVSQTTLA